MLFLAEVKNVRPEEFAPYGQEEAEAFATLVAEGVVTAAYSRNDGAGLYGVLRADSLEALEDRLQILPLTRHGLVEWTFTEVSAFGA